MKLLAIPVLLAAALAAVPAQAKLRVFACEPEWASLTRELAGDRVDIDVATTALQDVHVVEAKPSLIAKVRDADLAVCTGAELEVGWLPQLLKQSGNAKVASGPGAFMAALQVKRLEVPTAVDRADGDVHPDGNPHVQMDPRRILVIAKALDDCDKAEREAHDLVSVAGNLGLVEIVARARRLMEVCASRDEAQLQPAYAALEAAVERAAPVISDQPIARMD